MMNERLIAKTIKLVNEYYEAEGIYELTSTIDAQTRNWYNNSEIVDAKMLAAAVMSYGYYDSSVMWNQLKQLREMYFPQNSADETAYGILGLNVNYDTYCEEMFAQNNFHIGDIEAAQRDILWQY